MSVLLLNASYEPLMVVSWKRAMTLVVSGRAEMVEQAENRTVRSAGGTEFPLPHVVRLMNMVTFAGMRARRVPRFSRAGLLARDDRRCQVTRCDQIGSTIDHVQPRSRGGGTSWENCVLMCQAHNSRKGDKLLSELGWKLKKHPVAPVGAIALTPARHSEWSRWVTPASA